MSRSENDQKYKDLITECDQLLKAGKVSAISARLAKLSLNQVPRAFRRELAKICRRADLLNRGLKLLQPIVRSENKNADPGTDSEICEYAILLSRNGSVQEALQLLKKVKDSETSEALLASAFCSMAHWDYETVIQLLERLLATTSDPYQKLIARVNLASSYLATSRLAEAYELTSETIRLAQESKASRLAANCFEIRGQVYFRSGNFAKSREDLRTAGEILGDSQVYDQLFIRQWLATMEAVETKSEQPLLRFREEAVERRLWESVREVDLYRLHIHFDQKLFDHLMFGTPMPTYRQRIEQLIGKAPSQDHFIYGPQDGCILDLKTGEVQGRKTVSIEPKIHQLLAALLKDFYVPRNLGSLFGELYPEEFFDINSSPLRVRQLLYRARAWFEENKLNGNIEQTDGSYRLVLSSNFGIQVSLQSTALSLQSLKLRRLAQSFPNGVKFSAQEACEKLGMGRTQFRHLVNAALASGEICKFGTGRAIVYQVSSPSQSGKKSDAA